MFLGALDLSVAFVRGSLGFSAGLCRRSLTTGPFPSLCLAASASSAQLRVPS